ncbi:hypothetical protein ABW19_dt0203989 [Dactylella cylindrospora]|nr:hypothetical protein ABW19_dt0203989 [Dactylella cylindrospora]
MFMKIGNLCPTIERIGNLFQDSPKLQDEVLTFNAIIIEFCTKALEFLRQPGRKQFVKTLWKPFKVQFQDIEKQLEDQRQTIDDEVRIASEIAAHKARQSALIYQREGFAHRKFEVEQWAKNRDWQLQQSLIEKQRKLELLLERISTYNHARAFMNNRDRRHPETGKWLFELPAFTEWERSPESKILWYHGIPGSGKTMLATSLVDHIFEQRQGGKACIVYFFCDFQDPESLTYRTILSSLLKQLLILAGSLHPNALNRVEEYYLNMPYSPTIGELQSMFKSSIGIMDCVYFVLDGIDECSDADRLALLYGLNDLVKSKPAGLKIALSSRPEIDIPRSASISCQISLGSITRRPDLEAYITEELEATCPNLLHHSLAVKEEIKLALLQGAEGMFLWVFFQLHDIRNASNEEEIRDVLRNLPRGLHNTYEHILQKICDERNQKEALKAFKWISGSRRPLTLSELREAVSIRRGDIYHQQIQIRRNPDPFRIIHNCCNFVILNEGDNTVQYAHSTVAKYLETKFLLQNISFGDAGQGSYSDIHDTGESVFELCLVYLQLRDFETQVTTLKPKYPVIQEPVYWLPEFLPSVFNPLKSVFSYITKKSNVQSVQYDTGNIARQVVEQVKPLNELCEKFTLLRYVSGHWLYHLSDEDDTQFQVKIIKQFILCRTLPFPYHPGMEEFKMPDLVRLMAWACENDQPVLLRTVYEFSGPQWQPSSHDCSFLILAVRGRSLRIVNYLLSRLKIGSTEIDFISRELLPCAAVESFVEILERLLEVKWDLSKTKQLSVDYAALECARHGKGDVLERLLGYALQNDSIHSSNCQSVMRIAAQKGDIRILEIFARVPYRQYIRDDGYNCGSKLLDEQGKRRGSEHTPALTFLASSQLSQTKYRDHFDHDGGALKTAIQAGQFSAVRFLLQNFSPISRHQLFPAILEVIHHHGAGTLELFNEHQNWAHGRPNISGCIYICGCEAYAVDLLAEAARRRKLKVVKWFGSLQPWAESVDRALMVARWMGFKEIVDYLEYLRAQLIPE